MATRRQRPSLDAVTTSNNALKNPTLEAFEDFRRRHSRQNKDIVIDNALRRTTVKTLQDEIAKLHIELLSLRQANVLLATHVKRLKAESTRSCNDATRDAIDQILGAVPALRQFRDALQSPARALPSDKVDGEAKAWVLESTDNPTATRPAAFGADLRKRNNLTPLVEISEYGSDDGEYLPPTIDERRIRRISKGRRRTEIGSVALRSPRPNGRPIPSDIFVIDTPPSPSHLGPMATSPVSSRDDSPSPRKKTSPEKRVKKRRQSGTLRPPQSRKCSSPNRPIAVPEVDDIPDWDEGENIVIPPARSAAAGHPEAALCNTVEDRDAREVVAALSHNAIAGPSAIVPPDNTIGLVERPNGTAIAHGKGKTSALLSTVPEDATAAVNSLSSRPSLAESMAFTESDSMISAADDDIGRGRRARKSVNYKEPSLMKKMRKPDGVSVEETLRLPRQSLSSGSLLPLDTPEGVSITSTSSRSVNSKRALQHLSGPRRKSVLPRPGVRLSRLSSPADDDEDEVEDDLDVQLGLRDDAKISPSDDEDDTAMVLPPRPSNPVLFASPSSGRVQVKKSTISVSRISPPKTVKKAEGQGISAVRSTPVSARVASGGSREALKTRPDANGRSIPTATVSLAGKSAQVPRRPISTARKTSA